MKAKNKKNRKSILQGQGVNVNVASKAAACTDQPNSGEINRKANYQKRFLKEPDVKAKEGKLVYVSLKHHECLKRIAQIVGKNEVSIYGVLNNILAEHFELHSTEIQELYDEQINLIFKW